MKIKNSTKFINLCILGALIIFLGWSNYSYTQKNTAQAAYSPNEEPNSTITLPFSGTIASTRVEMDAEGNQYYTWSRSDGGTCSEIYYQVYNRSGIPITAPTNVVSSCTGTTQYYSPDIAITNNQFYITYLEVSGFSSYSIILKKYSRTDHTMSPPTATVSDGQYIDYSARPRLAISTDGTKIGIVFQVCDDVSCNDHDVFFQSLDNNLNRLIVSNEIVNGSAAGDQRESNISYSGEHFMVTFTETNFVGQTGVQATAFNADRSKISDEIHIDGATVNTISQTPDITGMIDAYTETDGVITETFYIVYNYTYSPSNINDVMMKKVYCDYDTNTNALNCDKTTREGETVAVRVNTREGTSNTYPVISSFQNTHDIKREKPYENTSIDYLTVAWINQYNGSNYLKAQNYSNTLVRAGNEIEVSADIYTSTSPAIASSRDGSYAISYNKNVSSSYVGYSTIYPSQFLKIKSETIVNAPDSYSQDKQKVAMNGDGHYVITYESFNGTDYDIIYTLFDQDGHTLKTNSIANTTTSGDQINPQVSFWYEDQNSANFGKFIIVWEGNGSGDSDGIFYQIFNSDGSPSGTETLANNNTSSIQSEPDLSTGKFGQTAITYTEEASGKSVILLYKNNSNNIYQSLDSGADYTRPLVALSPAADGSTGITGESKFALMWKDGEIGSKNLEGYLNTSTSLTISSGPNSVPVFFYDLDGGYQSNFIGSYSEDKFFYAAAVGNIEGTEAYLGAKSFNTSNSFSAPIETNQVYSVSINPLNNNILVGGKNNADYTNYVNTEQVILYPANDPGTIPSNSQFFKEGFFIQANSGESTPKYTFLNSTTAPFENDGSRVGTADIYTTTDIKDNVELGFSTNISDHFYIGQKVNSSDGASGVVKAISNYYIYLEDVTGFFDPYNNYPETLDNSPYNDLVGITEYGLDFYFGAGEGANFSTNTWVTNTAFTSPNVIKVVSPSMIATSFSDTSYYNDPIDDLYDFNSAGSVVHDSIEYVTGTFFQFDIQSVYDEDTSSYLNLPTWKQTGPTFSANKNFYYGQVFSSADVAFNTLYTANQGFGTFAYSNISSNDYVDSNGVYQQLIDDPYTIDETENLQPIAQQEITPGGKYIIVPATIDFGQVQRGTTASVNFYDLSPSCIEVIDLDGTDFDLTVNMTDLTNTTNEAETIPKENFIIENNDGIRPVLQTNYSFTSLDDVTPDPSTDPGQGANLGTSQTLLKKQTNNPGSWIQCLKGNLVIPSSIGSGTYSGTLTFTLI